MNLIQSFNPIWTHPPNGNYQNFCFLVFAHYFCFKNHVLLTNNIYICKSLFSSYMKYWNTFLQIMTSLGKKVAIIICILCFSWSQDIQKGMTCSRWIIWSPETNFRHKVLVFLYRLCFDRNNCKCPKTKIWYDLARK